MARRKLVRKAGLRDRQESYGSTDDRSECIALKSTSSTGQPQAAHHLVGRS